MRLHTSEYLNCMVDDILKHGMDLSGVVERLHELARRYESEEAGDVSRLSSDVAGVSQVIGMVVDADGLTAETRPFLMGLLHMIVTDGLPKDATGMAVLASGDGEGERHMGSDLATLLGLARGFVADVESLLGAWHTVAGDIEVREADPEPPEITTDLTELRAQLAGLGWDVPFWKMQRWDQPTLADIARWADRQEHDPIEEAAVPGALRTAGMRIETVDVSHGQVTAGAQRGLVSGEPR